MLLTHSWSNDISVSSIKICVLTCNKGACKQLRGTFGGIILNCTELGWAFPQKSQLMPPRHFVVALHVPFYLPLLFLISYKYQLRCSWYSFKVFGTQKVFKKFQFLDCCLVSLNVCPKRANDRYQIRGIVVVTTLRMQKWWKLQHSGIQNLNQTKSDNR